MMGGEFDGHPLKEMTVKNEDPASPINAAFEGRGFEIRMETYVFRAPYSREKLHVLLSVDWEGSPQAQADMARAVRIHRKKPRPDNDYALSWIRQYALRDLAANPDASATAVIREALRAAQTPEARIALINALGYHSGVRP